MRQPQRPDHFVCALAILAEMLGCIQAGISVMLQETKEVVAPDEVQLAGLESFGRKFIRLAGNGRMQAQHFTGLRDAQDQRLPVPRGRRQLHTSDADYIQSPRRLTLYEQ